MKLRLGPLSYNVKCIIQGGFVVYLFFLATKHPDTFPEFNFINAFILFYLVYAGNAILDEGFGCNHGTFWRDFVKS